MNIGASAPEEFGIYFSWGNVPGHAEGSGYDFSQAVYDETPGAEIEVDLTLAEDMARLSLGSPWRLPTKEEFQELFDNCTSVWTTLHGVAGRLFTSNANGNNIFLPAAGLYEGTSLDFIGQAGSYWSSSYYSNELSYRLRFSESEVGPQDVQYRHRGFTVRAVFRP